MPIDRTINQNKKMNKLEKPIENQNTGQSELIGIFRNQNSAPQALEQQSTSVFPQSQQWDTQRAIVTFTEN